MLNVVIYLSAFHYRPDPTIKSAFAARKRVIYSSDNNMFKLSSIHQRRLLALRDELHGPTAW